MKALLEVFSIFSKFERHFAKHPEELGAITKDGYYIIVVYMGVKYTMMAVQVVHGNLLQKLCTLLGMMK
jgi:hypothetical protein